MCVLSLQQVSFAYRTRYQTVYAVKEVSCALEAGALYALVGKSGSGKTTLLSLLAGLEKPDTGKILFLTESFSDVVMPFLACNYSEVEELDLRCFTGSLEKYIEESKPDAVVILYSAYDFNAGTHMDLFNFA